MEKTTQPYEFLVRWGTDGSLSGAHVIWREVITDDGQVIADRVLDAQPVAVGAAAGFPLADIVNQATTDALAAVAAKDQRIAELEAELTAAAAAVGPE